jgi:hypothetical protein
VLIAFAMRCGIKFSNDVNSKKQKALFHKEKGFSILFLIV